MYWDLYYPQPSCGTAVADSVRPGKGKHMQDKKQKKAKIQVIFLILISTLVLLADFYAIINYPKEYMLIAAITVIFMICLWGDRSDKRIFLTECSKGGQEGGTV